MSKFHRWLQTAIGKTSVITCAVGFGGLITSLIVSAWPRHQSRMDTTVEHVCIEIFAALFVVPGIEILRRLLESWLESRELTDFARFFGDGVLRGGALAVFPTAEPPMDNSGFCDINYPRPPPYAQKMKGRAKGIQHVVPYEDLRAVLALSELYQKMRLELKMSLDWHFVVDSDPFPERTLIGIGLGFNHVTAKLAAMRPDLYRITFQDGTDDFLFAGQPHDFPKDQHDCAVVARIIGERGDRPHFVCAGRTAAGTAAAGLYLASHWKEMLAFYDDQHRHLDIDSLAVLLRFPDSVPEKSAVERKCFSPLRPALTPRSAEVLEPAYEPNDEIESVLGI